jgi:hypothetical protein
VDAYLTVAEMAAKFRITPRTVRKRVKAKSWPCWGEGVNMRFSPEHVAYVEELESHAAKSAPAPAVIDLGLALEGIKTLNRSRAAR